MFVAIQTALLAVLLAGTQVRGHLQMTSPFPLRSSLNPANPEALKDYSMTTPLTPDGTQYPCKGYHLNTPLTSVITWSAGSTQSITIAGTATHNGGSCQFSMSYDGGKSWKVIQSIMGGCMIEGQTLSVTIPSSASSGAALFAWAWFNHSGNREMYQNCAAVTITGGGSGLTGVEPYVANVGSSINNCVTIENHDTVFPNPGSVVNYGGAYAGGSNLPDPSTTFTGSNCVGPGASSSGSGSGSGSGSSSSSSSVAQVVSSAVASSKAATSAAAATTSAPAAAQTTSSIPSGNAIATHTESVTVAPATTTKAKSCKRRRRMIKRALDPLEQSRAERSAARSAELYAARVAHMKSREEHYLRKAAH